MARKVDVSSLRDEATKLIERGKLDKAIEIYEQLETAEPTNPAWPKRIGETKRRAGDNDAAIVAFERAAERYALAGFLVQAIAVCKLILQIDPEHSATQHRLGEWIPKPAPRPAPEVKAPEVKAPQATAPVAKAAVQQRAVIRAPAPVARPQPQKQAEAERPRPASEQRLPKPVPRPDDLDPETIPRSQPIPVIPLREVDTQRATDVPRASDDKRRRAIAMPPPTDPPPAEEFEIELARPSPTPRPRHQGRLDISELPIPIDDRPIEISGSSRKLGTSERSLEIDLPKPPGRKPVAPAARAKQESVHIPIDVDEPGPRSVRAKDDSVPIPIDVQPAVQGRRAPDPSRIARGPSAGRQPEPIASLEIPIDVDQPRSRTGHETPIAAERPRRTSRLMPAAPDRGPTAGAPKPRSREASLEIPIDVEQPRSKTSLEIPIDVQPAVQGRRSPPGSIARGPAARSREPSLEIPIDVDEPRSQPSIEIEISIPRIELAPGSGLDSIDLSTLLPGATPVLRDDGTHSGLNILPLGDPVAIGIEDSDDPTDRQPGPAARRALLTTPLFPELPAKTLETLVARMSLVELQPDEVLFREGETGRELFVISEGEVAVEVASGGELARLGPSAFFGEIALVTDLPRSATIRALTRVELLAIDRELIREAAAEQPEIVTVLLRFVRDRLIDRITRTSELFAPFSADERAALSAKFELVEVVPDAVLIVQGERSDGLYLMIAGQVEVWRDGEPAIANLGSGDVFGELSLLAGGGSTANVRSVTRVVGSPGTELEFAL